jgi:hypothetical protein
VPTEARGGRSTWAPIQLSREGAAPESRPAHAGPLAFVRFSALAVRSRARGGRVSAASVGSPCGRGTAASGRHGIATGDREKGRSRVSNSRKDPPRALVLRAGPRLERREGARHPPPAPVARRSPGVHDHGPPTFEPREGRRRRGWHGRAGPRGPTRQRRREPAQRGATARRFYPERAPNSGEVGAAPRRGFEPAEGWKRRFHLDAGDRIGWERRAVHKHADAPAPRPGQGARPRLPPDPSVRRSVEAPVDSVSSRLCTTSSVLAIRCR